jgi:hypothetical protein
MMGHRYLMRMHSPINPGHQKQLIQGDTHKNESSVNGYILIDPWMLNAMGKKELIIELKKCGQELVGRKVICITIFKRH